MTNGSEIIHKIAESSTAALPIVTVNHILCKNASSVYQRNEDVQGTCDDVISSRSRRLPEGAGIKYGAETRIVYSTVVVIYDAPVESRSRFQGSWDTLKM